MKLQITKHDVTLASRVYWFLFWAPVLALPCWGWTYASNFPHTALNSLSAAAIPLVFYIPVLVWSTSANPYLKAHARQALLLVALRFLCAWLATSVSPAFLLFNVILWLVGSLLGLAQAGSGLVWLGNI